MKPNTQTKRRYLIDQIVIWITTVAVVAVWMYSLYTSPGQKEWVALSEQPSILQNIHTGLDKYESLFTCALERTEEYSYAASVIWSLCVLSPDVLSWFERIEWFAQYEISQLDFLSTLYAYESALGTFDDTVDSGLWNRFDNKALAMYDTLTTKVSYSPYAPMSDALAAEWMDQRFQAYSVWTNDGVVTRDELIHTLYLWLPSKTKDAYALGSNKDLIYWLLNAVVKTGSIDTSAQTMAASLEELLTTYTPYQIALIHNRYAEALERIVTILEHQAS